MNRIVMFSGGVGSWGAARRVVDMYGTDGVTLLFTDTLIEDEDLYRFLEDAATNIGAPLVKIADGRTPWQVFSDERFIGNNRVAPCSKILKRQLARKWVLANYPDPSDTVIVLGIDWSEMHRVEGSRKGWEPYAAEFPLCDRPYIDKRDLLRALNVSEIAPPRLYGMGFPHNNCGGFCVRSGKAQFALLLERMPERYAMHEKEEQRVRKEIGRGSILQDTDGSPMTLRQFRRLQEARRGFDEDDWGGCGCFVDEDEE